MNPGQNGNVTLNNVTATNIVILSGGTSSIILDDVNVTNQLTVKDDDSVRVETKGTTTVAKTLVQSGAILEATAGSFGAIELAPTSASPVTLKGNFGTSAIQVTAPNTVLDVALGAQVGTLTVDAPSTTVTNNGAIDDFAAQSSVNFVNNGNVTEISGDSEVNLSGTGTVEEVTNSKPVVNVNNQDSFLTKKNEMVLNQNSYETTFTWGSKNGIGSGEKSAHTSPGGYNYYENGAYLDITIQKDGEASNAKFDSILSQLTLQTNSGNIDDISGGEKTDGRQPADWGKSTANPGFSTKLKEDESNAVFYGVRQNNTNGVATVGFNAGEKRDVNLTFSSEDNLAEGTYTITIQPKQQVSQTQGKNVGDAITYTFTVKSIFEVASSYEYSDYTYSGTSALTKTQNGFEVESIYANENQLLDGTAMKDMARYLGALQYANRENTPQTIVYNNNSYTWNPIAAGNLKGSNWYDTTNSKTLVAAITEDIQAIATSEGGPSAAVAKVNEGINVSVDGKNLILKSKAQ